MAETPTDRIPTVFDLESLACRVEAHVIILRMARMGEKTYGPGLEVEGAWDQFTSDLECLTADLREMVYAVLERRPPSRHIVT